VSYRLLEWLPVGSASRSASSEPYNRILAKKTTIAVETVADGTIIKPDHVYSIAPNTALTVADGVLRLHPRDSGGLPHKPVRQSCWFGWLGSSVAEPHHGGIVRGVNRAQRKLNEQARVDF
jgi:hypothetical protein